MSSEPNEHINKGGSIEFDCGTIATLTHMSPILGKNTLAGITLKAGESGGLTAELGVIEHIELLFYIRNIPSIIHMLQRIYKTGMGTH